MAGGQSTRMGYDKALITFEGETLLQRAVRLCGQFCNQLIISSNSETHNTKGILRISDEIANCGPLGGIYSSLKSAENEWSFILSVDAAFVVPEFISYLISQREGYDAVVPLHNKGLEPLVAMYRKAVAPMVKKQLESREYKMELLIRNINTNFIDGQMWVKQFPKIFVNLNTPVDLDKNRQFLV